MFPVPRRKKSEGGNCKNRKGGVGTFCVARRLVAAALLARDPAAVFPFNRGSHHAAALPWDDGDITGTDANCGVGVLPSATVPIKLVVVLHWNAACRRSLNSLRDRVGVSEVVLVAFGIGWRYLLDVMAERN